jgi:hypothetical protein
VIVSSKVLAPGVGTVPLCQLPPMNQSLDVLPVQILCARAAGIIATKRSNEMLGATTVSHPGPTCAYLRFTMSGIFDMPVSTLKLFLRHCRL